MPESKGTGDSGAGRKRVLVVEDESLVAFYLEDALEAIGYDCCAIAGSADEAVAAASRESPAVALVDIGLHGESDGIALACTLRDDFHIPVIFLSGATDAGTMSRAETADPVGFLVKPCTEDDLAAALRTGLKPSAGE